MTLIDAGPLVALIDADEDDHLACVQALNVLSFPLQTTWPAFTEAMYLLNRAGGSVGRQALWKLLFSGRIEIVALAAPALERTAWLMEKYADVPMDLANATLVALAEQSGDHRIFTLDSDFLVYRVHGRGRFDIVPT